MSAIPGSPERFFNEYVPAELARLKGTLGDRSSVGSVVFEVTPGGAWSLGLEKGAVRVTTGVAPDVLVRITVGADDFVPVVVGGAERLGNDTSVEQRLVA